MQRSPVSGKPMSRGSFIPIALTALVLIWTSQRVRADDQLDKLTKLWTSQEQEITTARVRLTRFTAGPRQELTAHQVLATVAPLDNITSAQEAIDLIEQMRDTLLGPPKPNFTPYWRDRVNLQISRQRVREEVFHHGKTDDPDTTVLNGREQLTYQAMHNQCSIFPSRQPVEIVSLSNFWMLPTQMPRFSKTQWQGNLEEGWYALRAPQFEILADPHSGYVKRISASQNNLPYYEYRQSGRLSIPGMSGPLPLAVADLRFPNGAMGVVTFYVIEDFQANVDLPESTFRLGSKANTAIYDLRADPQKPILFVPSKQVDERLSGKGRNCRVFRGFCC